MPLSPIDAYLRAERQPPSLITLGVRLKQAYGVGADNFGVKGNLAHYTGYHRSRAFLLNSPQGNGGDYSTGGSLNNGGNPNNNSAFDFTPGAWGTADNRSKMIVLTKRLRAAARAGDRRLDDYYEFAGTEDGAHVVTFYAQGGAAKSPFDSSHLDHIHGSKYRSRSDNDDTGIGNVMLGIGTGSGAGEDDDMGQTLGPFPIEQEGFTSLSIPPVAKTGGDSRVGWLRVCNDTGNEKYGLRIWGTLGDGGWFPLSPNSEPAVDSQGRIALASGRLLTIGLPTGLCGISIFRIGVNASGAFDDTAPYSGGLSCCIDQAKATA